MQSIRATAVVIALNLCVSAGAESPLHRAISMLEKLKAGINKDAEKEDAEFEALTQWCKKGSSDLKYEIKTEVVEEDDLTATMSKADADTVTASSKIEDEASSQSESDAELKGAKGIRAKEHAAFLATEAELQDSIDTLERASNVLQRKMRGNSLVQTSVNRNDIKALIDTIGEVVNAAGMSLHDKTKLMSLAQTTEDDSDMEFGTKDNKASSSVLDLLEDLKQKAEKQLSELRKEETNARQNFEMAQASLNDEIKLASKNIVQAKDGKAEAIGTKATAHGDFEIVDADLKVDRNSLGEMDRSCVDKAADYDEAVKNRGEELTAIGAALKALSQSAGGAAASFVEIRSSNPDRYEVVNVLRKNPALAQLAGRISTVITQAAERHQADPFKKVRNMIEGMISKIEGEASNDASRKAYCDKEKKASGEKKDELGYKMDKATATSDKAKSKAAALNEEISALQKELAKMATQSAEATAIRKDEKSTYDSLKADLESGLEGVRAALKVLHAQYGESAKVTGGMKTVFSMLEIVEDDTSKSLANADAEEKAAASEFKQFVKDNALAVHTKTLAVKYKSKESKTLAKTLTEYTSDLDGLSNELDAVQDYAKKIRSTCEQPPESYEEKQARQKAEMDGLNEALAVLDGETSLLQRSAIVRHSSLRGA